jgi:mannose/cellobiose epimerase-like protein (N-acyl-D-glucosamine 2-epimerase family)
LRSLESAEHGVRQSGTDLLRWLVDVAYPLWAVRGVDPLHGGFHESLDSGGEPVYEPRRIRVQARQVYCFARAASLGWSGAASNLVVAGLTYISAFYRRPDGLFRTLVAPDGAALDERAFLYDQAFVLLAFAEAQRALGSQLDLGAEATQLREVLYRYLKRPDVGFRSGASDAGLMLANPHMHLLEAALAWTQVSDDPEWHCLANEVAGVALDRFLDARTGAVRERFATDWSPLGSVEGPVFEPGHLFEWAWLLFRWSHSAQGRLLPNAQRLVEIAESHGVCRGIAVNSLLEDLSVGDSAARLWPQAERLKAAVYLAKRTRESRYWATAASAVAGLSGFLNTRTPGLWHDWLDRDGGFAPGRAPASTFYHIVCAIAELAEACEPAVLPR